MLSPVENQVHVLTIAMINNYQRLFLNILIGLCVSRYIAIVHPIQAHILCGRVRTAATIAVIWPVALLAGLPTMIFNQVRRPQPPIPIELCIIVFPGNHAMTSIVYKIFEFLLFFFIPIVAQTFLYAVISRRLFAGSKDLHRRTKVDNKTGGVGKERDSDAIRARKGVVKMLISSVLVYFFSYAPVQLPLFYNLMSQSKFPVGWTFVVCVMTLSYVNSAANPVLYAIFSQNFRRQFRRLLCRCLATRAEPKGKSGGTGMVSMDAMKSRRGVLYSTGKMSVTVLSEI